MGKKEELNIIQKSKDQRGRLAKVQEEKSSEQGRRLVESTSQQSVRENHEVITSCSLPQLTVEGGGRGHG